MSLIIKETDWEEMCELTPKPQLNNLILDDFEGLWGEPECLGRGYGRDIEVSPGILVEFLDYEYHQDLKIKTPVHDNCRSWEAHRL